MQTDSIIAPVADTPERRAFYERIDKRHLTPLWTSLANLVTPEPVSPCQPASWRFDERHEVRGADAVLFSYSDRPIQEALHLFREDRGNV